MKAVDTNVIVRVVTGDDEAQLPHAEAWIASGVWVSGIVLVELSWVLGSVYQYGKEDIAAAIEAVLGMPGVTVEEETTVRASLAAWRTAKGDVDFADCMILHTAARATHGPLGTFDAGLARVPGALGLGRTKRARR